MYEDFIFRKACKRVKQKKRFYNHVSVYVAFNTLFFCVVFFTGGGFESLIPASFWGIVLMVHYFMVFGLPGLERAGSAEWEARELRKEITKMGGTIASLPSGELHLQELEIIRQGWDEAELV